MKSYKFIKHPELFQGESYLKNNSTYFEGWYFKCSNGIFDIAFIPGISITDEKQIAFIQIITNKQSYFLTYPIEDFHYSHSPFYIKIGDNFFSMHQIKLAINDISYPLCLTGKLTFRSCKTIQTNPLCPNIMGPFSYCSSMECNHAILSMKHTIDGNLSINNKLFSFHSGTGYTEKDWGTSFPKTYIWAQANQFENPDVHFMLSVAHIPFHPFCFEGFICVLQLPDKELKFTTYNSSKLLEKEIATHHIAVKFKKGAYTLLVRANSQNELSLAAPIKGNMNKEILESITSNVSLLLKKDDQILFSRT